MGPQLLGPSPTQPPLQGRPRPAPTLGLLAPLKVLSCASWMRPPSLWPLTRSCPSWGRTPGHLLLEPVCLRLRFPGALPGPW